MRGHRWLLIGNLGLGSCLLAGCLRSTLPPQVRRSPSDSSLSAAISPEKPALPPSNYLVSQTPASQAKLHTAEAVTKTVEDPTQKVPERIVEPVEMRIRSEESSSPTPPPSPPPTEEGKIGESPHAEIHAVPFSRPDSPSVQALRSLLHHRPEEEINEQLKPYDPTTRDAMLLLLTNIVQLEQSGGIPRISPRDLAAWVNRLNALTVSLHGRAQLLLERACFCSYINNFGDFAPLPPEHSFFHPGEIAHVYVQARNLTCRRQADKYVTVLKAKLEVYDENSRETPSITWASEAREDVSASPRQDYYINFRFQVPLSCPAGLHTLRITVEDWTDAQADAKHVPVWRSAHCTLDFRVGGPIARPARQRIAEAAPN